MWLKIISSFVIICCSSAIGMQLANRYVQRLRFNRIIQGALSQLETEIVYYSTLLPEALEKVGNSVGEAGCLFLDVAEKLKERKGYSVGEAWNSALRDLRGRLNIGQQEFEILQRFSEQLGNSDKEGQKKYFQLVQYQLRNQEKNAEEMRLKYERMYRKLGLLLGLAISIILF